MLTPPAVTSRHVTPGSYSGRLVNLSLSLGGFGRGLFNSSPSQNRFSALQIVYTNCSIVCVNIFLTVLTAVMFDSYRMNLIYGRAGNLRKVCYIRCWPIDTSTTSYRYHGLLTEPNTKYM